MQSRLFAKKVIKMIGQGSIWEAFGGDFGACWVPNGSVEQFFVEVEFLVAKKSCKSREPFKPGEGGSL